MKRALFAAAIGLTFVALARPQLGFHWEEQKQRGIDILFAVDTSKSMLTQDVTPDRLTRAKLAITDFVNKIEGDRVGLVDIVGVAAMPDRLDGLRREPLAQCLGRVRCPFEARRVGFLKFNRKEVDMLHLTKTFAEQNRAAEAGEIVAELMSS